MKLKNIITIVLTIMCLVMFILCAYDKITPDTLIKTEQETEIKTENITVNNNKRIKCFSTVYDINYINAEELFANTDFINNQNDNKQHYKTFFVSHEQNLEFIKSKYGNELGFGNISTNGVSIYDNLKKYYGTEEDDFFNENALLVIYVPVNSGSCITSVKDVYSDGTNFCAYIENTYDEDVGITAMSGRLVVIEIPLSEIKAIGKFDAIEFTEE